MTCKERGVQEGRVFVTRGNSGNIVGTSLIWVVQPTDNGVWPWNVRWPPANASQSDKLLTEFFSAMEEQHESIRGKRPHIYFEPVIVDPAFRRKGHATALVQHAAAIDDDHGFDSYLDADEDFMECYQSQGYAAHTDIEITFFMKPMVRPHNSSTWSEGPTSQ